MRTSTDSNRFPPGPREGFVSGQPETNLFRLVDLFLEYGDIYKVYSPARGTHVYVVSDPDQVKHVLVTNHQNYTKGVGIDRVKILLGNGIMASEGDVWRTQRRMIQPFFQRHTVAKFCPLMTRCNQNLLGRWEDQAARGENVNITAAMSEVTLQIILSAIFSDDLETITDTQGANPFAILTEETARDLQFARKFRALGKLILDLVERRRRERRLPFDFLSMLMEARDKSTAKPMTERALLDEVMTLIVAGHETTASALNWTWYLISQHPEAEA